MKALVYTGTQELVYRDEPNPIEVSGESILKIHASGICGSDMHAYHGHDERRVPPLILGHEVSGEVQNGKFNICWFIRSFLGRTSSLINILWTLYRWIFKQFPL